MKNKTIKKRKIKSANYFKTNGESKYAKKVALQKKGIFSIDSPFKLSDIGKISLSEFNKNRFVHNSNI